MKDNMSIFFIAVQILYFFTKEFFMKKHESNPQIRKGDPLAQMNHSKNQNQSADQYSNSIGYKLNIRLRTLRTARGWSQAELGEMLAQTMGLSQKIPTSTVASWEHKNASIAKIPSADKINALAHLFDVSADYLKGLSDNPKKTALEYISNQSKPENIEILPQELAQHMGEPVWVSCLEYDGWMFLTDFYELVDSKGTIHSVPEIRKLNPVFSIFPPYSLYLKQIYNRYVIPETQIKNYRERMWVCINSPDKSLQHLNGWYIRTSDGIGVKGKTFLSFDSYFDFWIAYTTPIAE